MANIDTAVYKRGSKGTYVAKIQRALNEILKINLKADGDFGPSTEQKLIEWQGKYNLAKTGIFSDRTAAMLGAYIDSRFLKEQDFIDAASRLDVELASVKAVQEVESKGSGFLDDGRSIILFERHQFRRELNKAMALNDDIVNKMLIKLSLKPNNQQDTIVLIQECLLKTQSDIYNSASGGYTGGPKEYDKLAKASVLDSTCARKSASWGLFQIMGYHHSSLGFNTVDSMVISFDTSERNQLMGFVEFIKGKADPRLLPALKSKNWLAFARAYNGPNQLGYDKKLTVAYNKYSKA